MSTIGILGCGWLGVPLGKHLQQLDYTVKGSRTSESGVVELQKKGIEGCRVVLEEDQALGLDTFLDQVDTLLISLPPKRPSFRSRLCPKNPTTTGRRGLLSNSAYFIFE
jgi:phosphoglycerate dehydrogenase-like enzyme